MNGSIEIEAVAAAWLARRDSQNWSEEDELALAAWLDASTAHRVAFLRLEAAWRRVCTSFAGRDERDVTTQAREQACVVKHDRR